MAEPKQQDEFIDENWVKENRPQFFHTWDWKEHPEDYEGECYCYACRCIAVEG